MTGYNPKIGYKIQQLPGKVTLVITLLFFGISFLLYYVDPAYLYGALHNFDWRVPSSNMLLDTSEKVLSSDEAPTQALPKQRDHATTLGWIRLPTISNYTERILRDLANSGTDSCHRNVTTSARVFGLPEPGVSGRIRLSTGMTYELSLVSYGANGQRRCAGGDYYETDLSGLKWKSRPPTIDLSNGSYSVMLQVHPRYAGLYNLTVILLFANLHSLHQRTDRWIRNEEMLKVELEFAPLEYVDQNGSVSSGFNLDSDDQLLSELGLLELKQCSSKDFQQTAWTGRWTRDTFKEGCEFDKKGRFMCLGLDELCKSPWCEGPVGALESNGWVYSAHCSFKIFAQESAWKCLENKWLFFWGDSNHVDSIRNLLNFVLGLYDVKSVPRRFDQTFFHPMNNSRSVRITSVFNGHENETANYHGLYSLENPEYCDFIRGFFSGVVVPDVIVMNSGLHDGLFWKSVQQFAEVGVKTAVRFWNSILKNLLAVKRPRVIYRTTIATSGEKRRYGFNPHKMEVFNNVFVEKLNEAHLLSRIVDGFDLTYPWHYDYQCSDGVHYGKPPALARWHGQMGHHYFVDLMLVHILLHAICVD